MGIKTSAIAFLALLPSCPAAGTIPPADSSAPAPYEAGKVDFNPLYRLACENLAKIGCPESAPAGKTCAEVFELAEKLGNPLNAVCVANASTPSQVRACGSVRCRISESR